MTYKVGISSGWWSIAKDPALLGLAQKAGAFTATAGIQFNQVDLDTILEFLEPDLKRQITRVTKELGIKVGLHGEIGEIIALESAERRYWELSHNRLVQTMRFAADMGFIYVNIHASQTQQLLQRESQIRTFGYQYQLVSPEGEPMWKFCEKSKAAYNVALGYISSHWSIDEKIRDEMEEESDREAEKEYNEYIRSEHHRRFKEEAEKQAEAYGYRGKAKEDFIRNAMDQRERDVRQSVYSKWRSKLSEWFSKKSQNSRLFEMWKKSQGGQYYLEAGEIAANYIVAAEMIERGDPLWKNICNGFNSSIDAYNTIQPEYNAALSARYIEGHLNKKDHKANIEMLGGMSVKEWCEAKKIYLLIETPHTGQGTEGLSRFYHPKHMYELTKKINSPYIKLTIDFEQTMGQNLDLDKELPKLPGDFGQQVFLLHLGEPKPYWGTAHIPIALGSIGQEALYRWIYLLRQKGFDNGIIIFERGSGRSGKGASMFEVMEYSVLAIRQLIKYLDMDTKPDDLPPEFFGISVDNKDMWARQMIIMNDHKWDPLKGLFMIPEEEHTFLSKSAIDKGKREEWPRGRYR